MKKYLLKYFMKSENSFSGLKGPMSILKNIAGINPEIYSAASAVP